MLEGATQLQALLLQGAVDQPVTLAAEDLEGLLAGLPLLRELTVPPSALTEEAQSVLARIRPGLQIGRGFM